MKSIFTCYFHHKAILVGKLVCESSKLGLFHEQRYRILAVIRGRSTVFVNFRRIARFLYDKFIIAYIGGESVLHLHKDNFNVQVTFVQNVRRIDGNVAAQTGVVGTWVVGTNDIERSSDV